MQVEARWAEAFFRKYAPSGYSTVSAGTRPAGEINPIAIHVMKEVGIDISKQKSKIITEDIIRNATVGVNKGCSDKEICPTLFVHNLLEWRIEDPKGKSIDKVREILLYAQFLVSPYHAYVFFYHF
jgi:arsenate reductase (thioredoxin)